MTRSKDNRLEYQSALSDRAFPQSVSENATELEKDFATVNEHMKNHPGYSVQWSKATRRLMKIGVEKAIDKTLADKAMKQLSSKEDRENFSNLILSKIGTELRKRD